MDETRLRALLRDFKDNGLGVDDVVSQLKELPYQDLEFAKIDHHRSLRKGFPEVIFGQGKSPEQVASIAAAVLQQSDRLLVTRTSQEAFSAVRVSVPDANYDETARTIIVDRRADRKLVPGVMVVCAGTADLPVAREAIVTAELMDCEVEQVFDMGVAGIHRLLEQLPSLQKARVIVAVAGMEGALPSVIGGLVKAPVIAVPTSIGYGASFEGLAALLAMLNSCANGIGVVNIDNGFGAGYLAALINTMPAPDPNP
ncbi:MAG: nickel pincer cofactor biosynthesis protein LarB [Chloroflexi bacterium]|nr:nickel pincer cofactor biosynthesis protein LarB [Chloroflexota bacterium]